uniref:Axoneme-associated protein mst101(2)-like n=1 Tax=Heterorhabditis bacteriophora TaxID=37862 RepID=A0A1I7XII2_HETBA
MKLYQSKRSSELRQKKKDKREKGVGHNCGKEVRKMRNQCAKMMKCCSVAKNCNAEHSEKDVVSKKKELKKKLQSCGNKKAGYKKDKGRNRPDIDKGDIKTLNKARMEDKDKSDGMQEDSRNRKEKSEETLTRNRESDPTMGGKKQI